MCISLQMYFYNDLLFHPAGERQRSSIFFYINNSYKALVHIQRRGELAKDDE